MDDKQERLDPNINGLAGNGKQYEPDIVLENDGNILVKKWLKSIKMEQYYELFIQNGFESLHHIRGITNKSELKAMGINKIAHQCLLMAKIRRLTQQKVIFVDSPNNGQIYISYKHIQAKNRDNKDEGDEATQIMFNEPENENVLDKENKNIVENDENILVKEWLQSFKMEQYYQLFLQNGWQSLYQIRGIVDKSELKAMGIKKVAHQCIIMSKI